MMMTENEMELAKKLSVGIIRKLSKRLNLTRDIAIAQVIDIIDHSGDSTLLISMLEQEDNVSKLRNAVNAISNILNLDHPWIDLISIVAYEDPPPNTKMEGLVAIEIKFYTNLQRAINKWIIQAGSDMPEAVLYHRIGRAVRNILAHYHSKRYDKTVCH